MEHQKAVLCGPQVTVVSLCILLRDDVTQIQVTLRTPELFLADEMQYRAPKQQRSMRMPKASLPRYRHAHTHTHSHTLTHTHTHSHTLTHTHTHTHSFSRISVENQNRIGMTPSISADPRRRVGLKWPTRIQEVT